MKNYNEESDKGYFLGVNVQYIEELHELHSELSFSLVHRMIKCNQNAWLKRYVHINTDLGKKAKLDFEKYFFLS